MCVIVGKIELPKSDFKRALDKAGYLMKVEEDYKSMLFIPRRYQLKKGFHYTCKGWMDKQGNVYSVEQFQEMYEKEELN